MRPRLHRNSSQDDVKSMSTKAQRQGGTFKKTESRTRKEILRASYPYDSRPLWLRRSDIGPGFRRYNEREHSPDWYWKFNSKLEFGAEEEEDLLLPAIAFYLYRDATFMTSGKVSAWYSWTKRTGKSASYWSHWLHGKGKERRRGHVLDCIRKKQFKTVPLDATLHGLLG